MILSMLMTLAFSSCINSEKEIDKLEIAKQFYYNLDNSDHSGIKVILTDSIITKDGDYEQIFSLKEYAEWMKWDSVFGPKYDILQIEQDNGNVKAKISKMDKRIIFLHEGPIITNEIIQFYENKIISVERKNVTFNATTFLKNREGLLTWIDENHPELNGFLHDQTVTGGKKYLRAIELYKNKK